MLCYQVSGIDHFFVYTTLADYYDIGKVGVAGEEDSFCLDLSSRCGDYPSSVGQR